MPLAPPTGTVTFLFSDIEGSTVRWEEYREAMSGALQRHDTLLRRSIEAHGGYVFKTVGDEFCSAFARPQDALAAALEAQQGLATQDFGGVGGIRVRMALHTGTAEERDGDYFGPAVNRVARLLALGYGGQVLLSNTVMDLVRGDLPSQTMLHDLGVHRLKDLNAERVYQLVAPGLPNEFPALRSVDALPNNLPLQLTPLIGRDNEVAEIKALLREHRLVTLVGTGGAGKTRCALQAGAEVLDAFADGVWLVELAPLSDASLVANVIAQALNLQLLANKPVIDIVVQFLKYKKLLLIVDNCEHLIDEARNVITRILQACDGVHILATSRERFNVAGESVFPMPSLPVPPPDPAPSPDTALEYGATALFAARATSADSRFAVTIQNAPVLADICRRVDGIPLAIELAAARIRVLSPSHLLEKLDDRFRVLTGGDRTALPRQQTMRALIDWSYDLLTEQERALFRKLAIFAGGFTLETVQAVCRRNGLDELTVLDLLTSLVDKSLVQVDPASESTRYRLLESTRQYAREKLQERGEYDATAHAHAEAFLALAKSIENLDSVPDAAWFAIAEPELDNWRAALEWTLDAKHDVALGQRLVGATRRTWSNLAVAEGARRLRVAMAAIDDSTPRDVVADLDQTESQFAGVFGLHKASLAAAQRALEHCRALGDMPGVAKAQRQIGRGLVIMGDVAEGEALLREALAIFRASGDRALTGATLDNLAIALGAAGDFAGARACFAEALQLFKAIGADRLASAVESNLAESEFHAGNVEEALRLANDALASDVTALVARRRALLLSNVAAYLNASKRYDEARTRAREALIMARSLDYAAVVTWAIQHLAAAAVASPDGAAPAARLSGYLDARIAALEMAREFTEQQEHEATLAALRDRFSESELALLLAEGAALGEDAAAEEALRL